ncbi:MAG: FAD-dependent oxidoreductase [Quadrisphaera sp.]
MLVSAEPHVPVDRTQLSKFYLAGAKPKDALPLLAEDWYAEHGVELRLGSEATVLDTAQKRLTVRAADGATTVLGYDALVLAPGSEPVRPDLPGFGRDDVHVLRTLADADALLAAVGDSPESRRAVVLGAGFIGLEAAAVLREKGVDVSVVATSEVPLRRQMARTSAGPSVTPTRPRGSRSSPVVRPGGTTGCSSSRTARAHRPTAALTSSWSAPASHPASTWRRAPTWSSPPTTRGVVCSSTPPDAPRPPACGPPVTWPPGRTRPRAVVVGWSTGRRRSARARRPPWPSSGAAGRRPGGAGVLLDQAVSRQQYRLAGDVPDLSGGEGSGSAEVDGSLADGDAVVRYRDADGRVTAVAGVGRDLEVLRLEEELLRP